MKLTNLRSHLPLLTLLVLDTQIHADSRKLIATSGNVQVQLIELYSSESCSSCPPAEKWISEFKDLPGLWKNFVPIVLHVDYWNHLGWKDKFSSKEMTLRQVEVSNLWPKPTVYTPAVVINGKEWSQWRNSKPQNIHNTIKAKSKVEISIFQENDLSYSIHVKGAPKNETYQIWVAHLGMDIKSKITSGENSGENFNHNFVVLHLEKKALLNVDTNFKIPSTDKNGSRQAIVTWIEKKHTPVPIQATGGFL